MPRTALRHPSPPVRHTAVSVRAVDAPRGSVIRRVPGADGHPLFTASAGKGPPVVLCCGLGCAGYEWQGLFDELKKSHQVIVWHYRGHGHSKVPDDADGTTMQTLCDDLRAVLDAYGLRRADLIAYSMGAHVAFNLALQDPKRVRRIVTVCGKAGGPLPMFENIVNVAILEIAFAVYLALHASPWTLGLWYGLMNVPPALARRTPLVAAYPQIGPAMQTSFDDLKKMDMRFLKGLLHTMQANPMGEELQQIRAPTLVIGGADDDFVPAAETARLAQRIPGAKLFEVPQGTHMVLLERPEILHPAIVDFLR